LGCGGQPALSEGRGGGSSRRTPLAPFLALAAAALSVTPGAQSKASAPPAVDPYTRAEPAALARLGYRSLGPFRFGQVTTEVIAERLGDVPFLWVETEHFRIGSSLGEYKPTEPWEQERRKEELDVLRTKLERVPAKPKKFDPWLRLHLVAARLERLHADLRARLGLAEGSVADAEGAPVLGLKEKLAVLLTAKKSTLARYTREFFGKEQDGVAIAYDQELGLLFYGLSEEVLESSTESDLHYALVHGVTQNLVCAINGFPHSPPSWWSTGLALWFARQAEPRVQLFVKQAAEGLPSDDLADWQPLVRGRVEAGAFLGWPEMLARPDWLQQPFGDNVILWSRIDWILRREGLAPRLAVELHPKTVPPDSTWAFGVATGLSLEATDAAWRQWVLATYRKKR
jgi:hypothetical protein